jgi:glycosyltransferase involved in cell wall biosynthesis
LTGYVSESELAQLYASADFLVMPSLYEGFGLPIIEAQSFGVPVITSNRASMPEVAEQGAIIVDPTRVEDIANAIIKLHTDGDARRRLSEQARLNAARFSWSKACSEMLALAETAIEARRMI